MTTIGANSTSALNSERTHLLCLLEKGKQQFSGYALEIYERGILKKLERIDTQISEPKNVFLSGIVWDSWETSEVSLCSEMTTVRAEPPRSIKWGSESRFTLAGGLLVAQEQYHQASQEENIQWYPESDFVITGNLQLLTGPIRYVNQSEMFPSHPPAATPTRNSGALRFGSREFSVHAIT